MTVSDIKGRIAEICAGIEGITGADRSPRSLARAALPFVVVLTGEAQRFTGRDGQPGTPELTIVRRVYRLALIVKAWATGVETEAEEACEPFFERFEDAFGNRPGLYLDDTTTSLADVLDVWLGNDTGVINIELAEKSYAGVIFDLWVETLRAAE
ncbi:MAG: hypothetical protein KatS3mg051_1422 [Anaerolineae bacterium]|nr:MAG: hypothetical protein KatS3mg051_1422 [Anaerolineae bacterium]